MAATYRLALDTDAAPPTMVVKLATGDDGTRQRVRDGYRREVGFYRDIADTIDASVPNCWHAEISDDGLRFTLLLDDLQPMVPGVQAEGCTHARGRHAVRNLAALHAPRWNDASLFDADFLDTTSAQGAEFLGAVTVAATEEFIGRYEVELGPTDVATLRASAAAIAKWQLTRPEPFALSHGDYRLDNLMFAPDGEGVAVVDWQTLAVAPPARDLAYFLGTSLQVEDRRAAEAGLVETYHDELTARGVFGYSADACFDDYRLGQLQGPMITTLGCIYAPNARTPASDAMFPHDGAPLVRRYPRSRLPGIPSRPGKTARSGVRPAPPLVLVLAGRERPGENRRRRRRAERQATSEGGTMSGETTTGLQFEPPGPGSWGLDPVHFPRPVTRYWAEMHPEPFGRGTHEFMAFYGTPLIRVGDGLRQRIRVPLRRGRRPMRKSRSASPGPKRSGSARSGASSCRSGTRPSSRPRSRPTASSRRSTPTPCPTTS